MSLKGVLSTYPIPWGTYIKAYPYFTSGAMGSDRAVVFIGGLTNGMMDPGYLPALSAGLEGAGWKLVQMHWSSAYEGFGKGSLDRDVREMEALINHLLGIGISKVVIMGHSTGSQDVAHYLSTLSTPGVIGGVLQAPISDRHELEESEQRMYKVIRDALPEAQRLLDEGRGKEVMPVKMFGGVDITAYRLHSLCAVGGDDDYFSHDIPDEPDGVHKHPLSESFGTFSAPALVLYSEKDEYPIAPPSGIVRDPEVLMERWRRHAKHGLEWRVIKGANHGVDQPEAREEMVRELVRWLGTISKEDDP